MYDEADTKLEPISRDEEILDELAELGLALARGLQAKALAAEPPQEAAALATAFQRAARSVRQALALKAKLRRDEDRAARELHRDADLEIRRRIRQRKAMVQLYMHRAIAEHTPLDDERLGCIRLEDLRERLDDRLLDESFLADPFEVVIADLHRALGLPPPRFADPPDQAPAPMAFSSA